MTLAGRCFHCGWSASGLFFQRCCQEPWRFCLRAAGVPLFWARCPANYLAGAKFGAVTLPLGDVTTMLILVPLWMVMLPLMVKFSQRELAAA